MPDPKRDAVTQKIGDYYAACMDEEAIDAKGLAPLKPELDRIAALKDKDAVAAENSRTCTASAWTRCFSFSSEQDFKDSTAGDRRRPTRAASACPTATTTSSTTRNPSSCARSTWPTCRTCSSCSAKSPQQAAADAETVMEIETALAKASLDLVSRRDPENVYHKMTRGGAGRTLSPAFAWNALL